MPPKPKKILIVDDEAPLLKVLSEKLVREGFLTVEAKNGEQGLKVAIAERPDLILLDLVMPVMDGMEMMHQLREHDEWGKNVPIILLSNLASNDIMMSKIIRDTPAFYLLKTDWTPDDVVQKIRERLDLA